MNAAAKTKKEMINKVFRNELSGIALPNIFKVNNLPNIKLPLVASAGFRHRLCMPKGHTATASLLPAHIELPVATAARILNPSASAYPAASSRGKRAT
jgi:hypothetical protein